MTAWSAEAGKRLQAAVRAWGKQDAFADQAGIGRTSLHRVFNGMDPGDEALDRFVTILGTTAEAIRLGGQATGPVVEVPVYDVEVAAGAGRVLDTLGPPEFQWAFPKQWAEANLRNVQELKMFYVAGDSQEPELSRGDIVAVDTSATHIREGLYVVRHYDQLLVKRLQRVGEVVNLLSRNEDYPPVPVNVQEVGQTFEVVGRAVWASKML